MASQAPGGPQAASRGAQEASRGPQGVPGRAPGGPQGGPREPQEATRRSPGEPLEAPKRSQEAHGPRKSSDLEAWARAVPHSAPLSRARAAEPSPRFPFPPQLGQV